MDKEITLEQLKTDDLIIFEAIMGSNAYGTATPESDIDIRGIFIQPLDHVLKYGWIDQVADEKSDIVYFELGRYITLLQKNDPQSIEMLAVPDDCVLLSKDIYKRLQKYKYDFISKKVRFSFASYAIDQIKKARGYNKKMNWEASEMKRKTVLDFCYIIEDAGTIPFKTYLERFPSTDQRDFALSAIDHAHYLYAMFQTGGGIVSNEETANDVQLSSIPKNATPIEYLTFNKDAYSSHCIKYKEYQTWLKERNPNRFKMNKEHGKNYDSKNMMHTYRLLLMAHELAKGQLIVRRPDDQIEKLMKIRRGEYEYEDLLKEAEEMISGLDKAYENSILIKDVDPEFALSLLYTVRRDYYIEKYNLKLK